MRNTGPGLNTFLRLNLPKHEADPVSTMEFSGHSPYHPSIFVLSVDLLPPLARTRDYLLMYWLHMKVDRTVTVYTALQLVDESDA